MHTIPDNKNTRTSLLFGTNKQCRRIDKKERVATSSSYTVLNVQRKVDASTLTPHYWLQASGVSIIASSSRREGLLPLSFSPLALIYRYTVYIIYYILYDIIYYILYSYDYCCLVVRGATTVLLLVLINHLLTDT
jgi:hypothetical protein